MPRNCLQFRGFAIKKGKNNNKKLQNDIYFLAIF